MADAQVAALLEMVKKQEAQLAELERLVERQRASLARQEKRIEQLAGTVGEQVDTSSNSERSSVEESRSSMDESERVSVAVRLTELKQKREEHRQKGIRQSNEIRLQHGQDVAQVAGKPHCRECGRPLEQEGIIPSLKMPSYFRGKGVTSPVHGEGADYAPLLAYEH